MVLKLLTLPVALFLLVPAQGARSRASLPSGPEFPPQDGLLWMMQREGLAAKLAAERLVEAPDNPDTVRLLAEAKDLDGMLHALRLIVDRQPQHIADAFEAVGDAARRFRGDDEHTARNAETLRGVIAHARQRLAELSREDAARAERVFLNLDAELSRERRWESTSHLARFVEQHRGTEAALFAEVDLIGSGGASQHQLDALDAFVDAHPGTAAAGKALYLKGFQLSFNAIGSLEPRGADPTDRFIRVLAIVKELESGRYPKSEWFDKAASLVVGFYMPEEAPISPENVDRLLDAYQAFARTHFVLDAADPASNGIGYVITTKMAELFTRRGDGIAGLERALTELELGASDPAAVRYIRALSYMKSVARRPSTEDRALLTKARDTLSALSAEGQGLYHRKALATLASLDFAEGGYVTAREAFRKYVNAYPQGGWTWVAMVRVGQCEEALGDSKAAAAAYLEAANKYAGLPLARVLGHEYAARAYEAGGEFERAVVEHQRALDGWDNAFGLRYSTFVRRSPKPDDPFVTSADVSEVTKDSLAPRIAQLKKSLSAPGGALLERGRLLLAQGRQQEAIAELQQIPQRHPKSPAVPEARYLAHRARLERALRQAEIEAPDADEAAAMKELEALSREPHDFAVTAANIARASMLWKRGEPANAEALMREALTQWHAQQRLSTPSAGLEQDVAEIRRVVFLPKGGEIFDGSEWNAFSWPVTPPPFVVANPEVRVKLHDGEVTRVTLVLTFPGADRVLFFNTDQLAFLKTMIFKLGGTKRRVPERIMETPNQPVGASMQILQLWNKFFHARPGHWVGWEFESYPIITEIQFTDAGRTKAAARVTIGYSGATVELEKEGGKWVPKRLTGRWIT